jgi:hypothetical protein
MRDDGRSRFSPKTVATIYDSVKLARMVLQKISST